MCRNTLMYFNAETQGRILDRFHFALNEGGYLFLGKAEMLITHNGAFTPLDLKRRIFVKMLRVPGGNRAWQAARVLNGPIYPLGPDPQRLCAAALDAAPRQVVDADGLLAVANQQARQVFGLTPQDIGRPLQDLEVSFRPVELRSCIDQACKENRPVTLPRSNGAATTATWPTWTWWCRRCRTAATPPA